MNFNMNTKQKIIKASEHFYMSNLEDGTEIPTIEFGDGAVVMRGVTTIGLDRGISFSEAINHHKIGTIEDFNGEEGRIENVKMLMFFKNVESIDSVIAMLNRLRVVIDNGEKR